MNCNPLWIEKAKELEPALYHTQIKPVSGELGKAMKAGDSVCFDFGDHFVGYAKIDFSSRGSHFDAPAWIRVRFAERLCELGEKAEEYHGWISKGWIQQEQLHLDVLPCTLQMERRYAFRYISIEVLDCSPKYALVVENIVCDTVTSADDGVLQAYQGDAELAQLDRIACRTLRSCMQSVFEDGPKRDRRLWMGDLRMQALANYETYHNDALVKRCLYLFAGSTLDRGKVGACLFLDPEIEVDDTEMFDYSLFFIPTLLNYLEATGDRETAEELYDTAIRQLRLARQQMDENGIVRDSDRLGWCFVDWNLGLNKQAGAQGIYLYCLDSAIRLAALLGRPAETMEEELRANRKAAKEFFWDAQRKLFVSGTEKQVSWASQVWLVLGGVLTQDEGAALLERMETDPEAEGMVTPYMYHNYVDALIAVGQKEKALEVLHRYWGGMARRGADTFWELYDPADPNASPYGGTIVNSYCHAWSCAPAYFLRKYYANAPEINA